MEQSIEEISRRYELQKQENRNRNLKLAAHGVAFQDIDLAFIDEEAILSEGVFVGACVTIEGDVQIGSGTHIGSCVTIRGETKVGPDCRIGQNTLIQDSILESSSVVDQNSRLIGAVVREGASILESVVMESDVGKNTTVGPFAYIRPGCHIGENVRVGDFVELKNSNIGNNTKISHLTYVGDADLGESINLGCGVVFVNYDGERKYRSSVEDHAFIGCNVNLISPVTVEEGAYIAAGTTVTKSVPSGSLSVGRAKERIIENWTERRGILKGRGK